MDSYAYLVCKEKNNETVKLYPYTANPLDQAVARFQEIQLPSILVAFTQMEFHSRIIVRSKELEIKDFLTDTGYVHVWDSFSGAIGLSVYGTGMGFNIGKDLDVFNMNVRGAHVAPVAGWTYGEN